jgi:hypothetical protein
MDKAATKTEKGRQPPTRQPALDKELGVLAGKINREHREGSLSALEGIVHFVKCGQWLERAMAKVLSGNLPGVNLRGGWGKWRDKHCPEIGPVKDWRYRKLYAEAVVLVGGAASKPGPQAGANITLRNLAMVTEPEALTKAQREVVLEIIEALQEKWRRLCGNKPPEVRGAGAANAGAGKKAVGQVAQGHPAESGGGPGGGLGRVW